MKANELSIDGRLIKDIISYLIIGSIFITGEGLEMHIGFVVYWYHFIYIPFVIYCLLAYHRLSLKVLIAFIAIVLYSLLTFKTGINLVIKQLLNIGLSTLVFYYLIVHEKYNAEGLFGKIITFSKVVLILGFIQVILFHLGWGNYFIRFFPFLWETNMTVRLQSVTDEPSFIALTFVPVVFLSLYNLFYRRDYALSRRWAYLFVLGYLLTLSSIAFLGFLLMLLLLYFKNVSVRKLLLSILVFSCISFLSFLMYNNVSFLKERVDDTLYGVEHNIADPKTYRKINVRSYASLSN